MQRQKSKTDEETSDSGDQRGRTRGRRSSQFRSGSDASFANPRSPRNIESKHDLLEEKVSLIEDQVTSNHLKKVLVNFSTCDILASNDSTFDNSRRR